MLTSDRRYSSRFRKLEPFFRGAGSCTPHTRRSPRTCEWGTRPIRADLGIRGSDSGCRTDVLLTWLLLVCRRPEYRGHRHVQQAQVNGQLPAMVTEMGKTERPERDGLRQGEDDALAEAEGPRLGERLVGHRVERLPGLRDAGIQLLEECRAADLLKR